MPDANRITVEKARQRVISGKAILVCAYDSDEKFRANRLEGAIPFSEFIGSLSSLPVNQEIIFY